MRIARVGPERPLGSKVPGREDFAMSTDQDRVIVEDGLCACSAVHTKNVHHRDFPEIRAECGSVAEAVVHLAGQLANDREGARSGWHRESIDLAIADVNEFLGTLGEAPREAEAPCRCGPRTPGPLASSLTGRSP